MSFYDPNKSIFLNKLTHSKNGTQKAEEQEKETVKLKLKGEIPTLYSFKHVSNPAAQFLATTHTDTQKGIS